MKRGPVARRGRPRRAAVLVTIAVIATSTVTAASAAGSDSVTTASADSSPTPTSDTRPVDDHDDSDARDDSRADEADEARDESGARADDAADADGELAGLDLRSTIERGPAGPWLHETITVELLADADPQQAEQAVVDSGGTVIATTPSGVVLAEVPMGSAAQLERSTDSVVRSPLELDVRPERHGEQFLQPAAVNDHVTVTGVEAWHDVSFTGAGVRVGVIDFFNVPAYWDTTTMGPEPVPAVTAMCFERGNDCSAGFFTPVPLTGDDHGPAVVEIIKEMAPDAEIYIGRAVTESDYYALVDWFAANDVRVVNRSLGSRYDGPGDGRGALTAVADYAVDAGITWVNSGGNNGRDRYYRQPVRIVDGHVAFGPTGTTTWLAFNGCISPGGVRWAGDWDLPPVERTDYDVFIHQSPIGNPAAGEMVASSTFRQRDGAPPLEVFGGSGTCPAAGTRFYMRIQLVAGDPAGDVIEILDYADGIAEHTQAPYSAATSVVDSRSPGVVSVGAVDPPTSGNVGDYSSQGPTNDGRIKPDVVAPSGSTSVTFGGTFSGTSAAAPVVAGAAAVLLSAGMAADARSLGDLIRHLVVDGGAPGRDNRFGAGEFRLPAPSVGGADDQASLYVPLATPTRVLDTRPAAAIGPAALIGDRWPGRIVDVPIESIPGVDPSRVTAIAANVTVVEAERAGYTQAFPTGRSALSGFSNSNVDEPGQTRPNLMIVPVGADRTISIYSTSGGDLLVDVLGTFELADDVATAGRFVGLPEARRVLDTRSGEPVGTGQQIGIGMPPGVDPSTVAALVVNVTGTQTSGAGFVQAYPGGRTADIGRTSTLNLTDGATAANTVIVPVTGSGVDLHVDLGEGGSTHLIADVTGYITSAAAEPASGGQFVPVRPARSFDSRASGAPIPSGGTATVRAAAAPGVEIPASPSAVVWNLTATGATGAGYLSAWAAGTPEPPTSSLNWTSAGTTIANAGIIATDADATMHIRVDGGPQMAGAPLTHAIVDVFGYFT